MKSENIRVLRMHLRKHTPNTILYFDLCHAIRKPGCPAKFILYGNVLWLPGAS